MKNVYLRSTLYQLRKGNAHRIRRADSTDGSTPGLQCVYAQTMPSARHNAR
ncbi:hypothetical protein BN137_1385 [Cronobacter condimenti 1330]|uniref:Uncharacterized protein n=1 Tax=Cronobacter condimenti 1330 TaxID=1073999 RepID=K7ZZB7_9ENTR|nr:hypothetical protein BN137_1385 [Cronobacter condimenti 1330]